MNIIIPMAGRGTRLRPHTITLPKPLIPIAGKPIVQRLVEEIVASSNDTVEEIAFVIGDFGQEIEDQLIALAESMGAKGSIYYQDKPLGTAHAILCAKDALKGNVVIAFADTLFKSEFQLDLNTDGVIWVKQVEDPKAFGVVKLNDKNQITDFVEKPETFVSDLAIIGIYFIKDGNVLREEMQYLIDNNIKDKGEFQLTNALENMKKKGKIFKPGKVLEWLDCGNKNATLYTNERILELDKENNLVSKTAQIHDSVVIKPCFLGKDVKIVNSIVGPHVSIEDGTVIENCIIEHSIIQKESYIANKVIKNSMIGNHVFIKGKSEDLSVGDYTTQE